MKPSLTKNNPYAPYLLLLIQPIFMATNTIVARGGVESVPPISLAFWRWFTVFIMLLPFFYNEILKKLNFPVIVKPSNSGSSLGISKVINKSEILQALEKARKIDPRILIEEGLEVREIECGIIGNSKLLTSEIGEVNYESDWYDYDSKYHSNNKIIIPAEIDSKITKEIKEIAIKSCRALNIFGFARVDFFLEKSSNKILLNEINTIPGFTKNSMFPMLWQASGLNIEQLVAKLVEISLDL